MIQMYETTFNLTFFHMKEILFFSFFLKSNSFKCLLSPLYNSFLNEENFFSTYAALQTDGRDVRNTTNVPLQN